MSRPAIPTALSVNLNKVALVRNTRAPRHSERARAPPTLCLQAGAQGITVHPRPDARHIRAHDVSDAGRTARPKTGPASSSTSKAIPFHNLMDFVRELRPAPGHLRARQRNPVHQRPRLETSRKTPSACVH
jgi:pyridoxine 5-phosphate synthase